MGALEQIIDVQISRETSAVSQAGFGTGNFLSNTAAFQERIKEYGSAKEVTDDPLSGADTATFAAKYFGQEIRPLKLFVTKKGRDLKTIQTLDFAGDFITGNTIDLLINAVAIASVPFNTDQATTLEDLRVAILAHGDIGTATSTGLRQITSFGALDDTPTVFTGIAVTGGATQTTGTATVTQYEDGVLTNVASIQNGQTTQDDWYALAVYEKDRDEIVTLAAFIQPQLKIFIASSADADVLTTGSTDVASLLKAASYDRTAYLYSGDAANFPEGGWMGGRLPLNPGSVTWMFKTLVGTVVDALTSTERSNALGKNANVYTTVGGVAMTEEGKTAEGTYIDLIRGSDWIQARITENVFGLFTAVDKVSYTNNGINQVVNRIKQILDQARAPAFKILADDPAPVVSAPLKSAILTADVTNRVLPDVTFTGTFAGAIHKAIIRGSVSV